MKSLDSVGNFAINGILSPVLGDRVMENNWPCLS